MKLKPILALLLSFSLLSGCKFYPFDEDEPPAVEGIVWMDANQDGIVDSTEDRISDMEVSLYRSDGTLIGKTTTEGGYYSFPDYLELEAGSYYLVFALPEGYQVAGPAEFSPIDPVTGRSVPLDISYSKTAIFDLGLVRPAENQQSLSLTPFADSVVTENGPAGNFGDLDNFWLDNSSTAYLRFLLDGLPPDCLVDAVSLTLFMDGSGHAGGQTAIFTLPDPSMDWTEMGLTWNNRPAADPAAPVVNSQLADFTGQGSTDTIDLTSLFNHQLQTHPDRQYFDVMTYFLTQPPLGTSQGWYSRESQSPPMLGISYRFR